MLATQVQKWHDASLLGKRGIDDPLPQAVLVLESADHQAAALAVVAAMYGASTPTLEDLPDVQLLQAVLIADMLQVPDIVRRAVRRLCSMAESEEGLSPAVQDKLSSLEAWPQCLAAFPGITAGMQLSATVALWSRLLAPNSPADLADVLAAPHSAYVQHRLLLKYGHLPSTVQHVGDGRLLSLPLPAMQLLLSSDDLQVGYTCHNNRGPPGLTVIWHAWPHRIELESLHVLHCLLCNTKCYAFLA